MSSDAGSPIGRRVFLGLLGLGAVGVATGSKLSEWYQDLAKNDPTGLASVAARRRRLALLHRHR